MRIVFYFSFIFVFLFPLSMKGQTDDSLRTGLIDMEKRIIIERKNLNNVADSLIAIVVDSMVDKEIRRNAVFLLGRINSSKSISFLLKNILLTLDMDSILGDDDQIKEMPCLYSLSRWGEKEAVIPLLFYELNHEKSDRELIWMYGILKKYFGYNETHKLISKNINSSKGVYLQNLTILESME